MLDIEAGISSIIPPEYKFTDATLVRAQAQHINSGLRKINLNGTRVRSQIEYRDPKYFINCRTYGFLSYEDNILSLMASAGTKKDDISDQPITPLIVAPVYSTSGLYIDPETNSAWTSSFWVCENNVFKYINTRVPIPIDGLNTYFAYEFPELTTVNQTQSAFDAIAGDKSATRRVLSEAGILIPNGFTLTSPSSYDYICQQLSSVNCNNGIVVKESNGCQGKQVQIFSLDKIGIASEVIARLLSQQKCVVVEERVIPPACRALQSKKHSLWHHQSVDYNFRALVSLDFNNPRAVDSLIRFRKNEDTPVNISLDAKYIRTDVLNDPDLVDRIFRVAEQATKAVCQRALDPQQLIFGFAGVDLMIDSQRNIYVIEVNGMNSGCFEDLAALDGKPLQSVASTFFPESLKSLETNHQRRDYSALDRLKQHKLGIAYFQLIYDFLQSAGYYDENEIFHITMDSSNNNLIVNQETARILCEIMQKSGNPERFLKYLLLRLQQYPNDPVFTELMSTIKISLTK